jgi:hypothetical protein
MSPIGRIFIVLNLILAAGFLAAASMQLNQVESWKGKHGEAVAASTLQQDELNAQITALRVANDTATAEAATFRDERDDAIANSTRITGENGRLTTQVSEASAANTAIAGKISDIQGTLASIDSAKDQAVAARREAEMERDSALQSSQDANSTSENLNAANAALQNQISNLETSLADAGRENSSLNTQLATLVDVTGVSLNDIKSVDLINASVLRAVYDVAPGLVALNVGKGDNVQRGTTFEIYNGATYKGRVRVENVLDDMCTAIILAVEDGQVIGSGDKAATRL